MNRVLWGVFVFVLALVSFPAVSPLRGNSARVERTNPALTSEGETLYYRGQPFSGTEVERYQNGALYRETQYEKGKQEGGATEYALNGSVRALWSFHEGKKDGLQQGWFIEGPKRFEYRYSGGLLDGVQTEWHQNGMVFKRQSYVRGVETDKMILYPAGEVFTNYAKRAGRIYGLDGGTLCLEKKNEGER